MGHKDSGEPLVNKPMLTRNGLAQPVPCRKCASLGQIHPDPTPKVARETPRQGDLLGNSADKGRSLESGSSTVGVEGPGRKGHKRAARIHIGRNVRRCVERLSAVSSSRRF
jgi:hypothetical protein